MVASTATVRLPLVLCITALLLLLLLLAAETSWASSPSPSTNNSPLRLHPDRPPFVSHVSDDDLRRAWIVVKERHDKAVKQALSNFPTDQRQQDDDDAAASSSSSSFPLDKIELEEYVVDAPGSLPDFDDELEKRVFVTCPRTPLLSEEECASVVKMAEDHFAANNGGRWTTKKSGDYDIAGFMIKDVPAVRDWFVRTVRNKLFPLLVKTFPEFCNSDNGESNNVLCVDNAYLFKYTPETGRRSEVHTDSGCLSFTIALNSKSEYRGGGTWFEGLKRVSNNDSDNNNNDNNNNSNCVVEMDAGQVTIRPGGVKHAGNAVESGQRYIIGGFCMHLQKPEPVRMLLTPSSSDDDDGKTKKDELTIENLEAALAINPHCDSAYNLLSNVLKSNGEPVEKSQRVLEHCLEKVHPKSGGAAYPLGGIYLDQGKLELAKRCFEICLEADESDADAMTCLAQIHNAVGEKEREEAYYKRIINTASASNASIAGAYTNLGVMKEVESGSNNNDEEIRCYAKALEYQPDSFVATYSLGCAYAARERWSDATNTFRRAVELAETEKDDDQVVQALQSLYRSAMYYIRSSKETMPTTKEATIAKLHELMGGADKFNKLQAALAAGNRKQ